MFVDGPPGTIGPDGKPTETVTEENYFFRLSNYQRQLIDLIESGELEIQPEVRKNEVFQFLRGNISESGSTQASAKGNPYVPGALKDFSLSRTSVSWGVPVPSDPKHTIYVWFDALINYISAIGYGSDDPEQRKKFERFWPADLHLVGKEIIRFHCVDWPAVLLAAGLPLPKAITAHGWLLFEESKMSKSRGNIVRTETILDAFGSLKLMSPDAPGPELSDEYWKHEQDLFASDVIRYFLLREIPFGQDGSFSFDALVQRYNSDLANGYGNLVSRTLTLIAKSSAGIVEDCLEANSLVYYQPERKETHNHPANDEVLAASEGQLLGWKMTEVVDSVGKKLEQNSFADALTAIAAAIASVDQFMTSRKPWAATETDLSQRGRRSTLYTAAECIRIITALLYPVLPYATAKVWEQLGLGDIEQAAKNGELKNLEWGGLKPGTKLGDLGPIFPRAPKELIQVMTDMEQNNTPKKPEPSKLVDEKSAPSVAIPESSTDPGAPPRTELVAG